MPQACVVIPETFKGIALFTPGGDVVYCIDRQKQQQWHFHLCTLLREILALPEPPHFLIPSYTATVDRRFDSQKKQIQTIAEVHPPVQKHRPLLNALFGNGNLAWRTVSWQETTCNPILVETYKEQFPQLWENHDLVVRFAAKEQSYEDLATIGSELLMEETPKGYILRLFVAGNSTTTKQTLKTIHQLLEEGLRHPYTLKVIDISKYPEQAETHQISAIPTLIRVWPQPVKRIVGELEDSARVLQILAAC